MYQRIDHYLSDKQDFDVSSEDPSSGITGGPSESFRSKRRNLVYRLGCKMNAVITKRQKNTIMVLGGIAGVFGAVAGTSGLVLREKYLMYDANWDVDLISGFTKGYFGLMSGFILLLLGTIGYGLVYSRTSYLVCLYWFLSLSCDALCIVDTILIMPYTQDNGKFAWEDNSDNCTGIESLASSDKNSTSSNTDLRIWHDEYCNDIETIAVLLIIVTAAILVSLLFSCITTFVTSVALCRAKSIDDAEQTGIAMAPFSVPDHFQPMNFNNTVYGNDGFRK